MNINSISSISFKGYVPVRYMAKNPKNDKYVPVIKNENIRKCQSFVVRNLNGTAKNMRNDDFVNFYFHRGINALNCLQHLFYPS